MTGLILSFSLKDREKTGRLLAWAGIVVGLLVGGVLFGVRAHDPKGMNIALIQLNRWLVVAVAAAAGTAFLWSLISLFPRRVSGIWKSLGILLFAVLTAVAFTYLIPPVIQFTQEFVYFGESGISTKALLRAIGFALGLFLCLLLALSSFQVHRALSPRGAVLFLALSSLLFFAEYGVRAVASLQRLKVIPLSDFVFSIMEWGDAFENSFLFAQLAVGLVMLLWVIASHRHPTGEFPNRALLRKEKARLRGCRRWSWGLLLWGALVLTTATVLRYFDTRPPAEVQPEAYEMHDGIIQIELAKVSDGHLHKFSYVTPNGYDVRFLVVKKPAGNAYGVGLDACEICGIAGYFERGDEVICRRCDVVMNKNTIGFKGGCNPIPFPYDVNSGRIYIDVKELERQEKRFR